MNYLRYSRLFGEPDIIHAHVAFPAGYIASVLSQEYNKPFVVTEHMVPFPLPSFKHDFERYLLPPLKNASRVLTVGQNMVARFKEFGIEAELTSNFIDFQVFHLRETTPRKAPRIFALGRLEHQKGFDLLLEALKKAENKPWNLTIGGEGSLHKKLKQKSEFLGIDHRVHFPGAMSRKEVAGKMMDCDFFVLSSRHESFGIVLIEAMACGKPVVFTRCGGVTDNLPEFTGVPAGNDPESLGQAITRMLTTYQTYDPFQIRKFVEDNYSVRVVADQLEQVYTSAIAKQKSLKTQ